MVGRHHFPDEFVKKLGEAVRTRSTGRWGAKHRLAYVRFEQMI
jgi:hypothetical protein